MSLNDLMPYEDIVIGDGASSDGWGMDNPFAHLGQLGDIHINPMPMSDDPLKDKIPTERNLVNIMGGGNTTLPIKHPKK